MYSSVSGSQCQRIMDIPKHENNRNVRRSKWHKMVTTELVIAGMNELTTEQDGDKSGVAPIADEVVQYNDNDENYLPPARGGRRRASHNFRRA